MMNADADELLWHDASEYTEHTVDYIRSTFGIVQLVSQLS